jgi:hypothetical protein
MKTILLCVCLFACATLGAARDDKQKDTKPHPDLNGTWTLDNAKSDFGPLRDRPLAKAETTLVVAYHDPELKLTRTRRLNEMQDTSEQVFYTDERGETNPALIGAGDVKSKTKWDGDKIVTRARMERQTPRGNTQIDMTTKWELSSDGKTLTQTFQMSGEFGTQELKQVFHRAAQPATATE